MNGRILFPGTRFLLPCLLPAATPVPVLAIAESHADKFTQGSTGNWKIVVSNVAGAGGEFPPLTLTVNVPTDPPASVSLSPSDAAFGADFGTSLALSSDGTTAIIVAPQSISSVPGKAYVFTFT
jgi:hypothetical protein